MGRRQGRRLSRRFTVETTARAKRDLREIRAWLTQPGAGRNAAARLVAISSALRDLRLSAHAWPFGEFPGCRERPVAGHRIIYRMVDADDGHVLVLRVFGPGQDRRL